MSRRVTEIFAEAVEAAIGKHGQGEEIRWDTQLAPNDQGGISLVLVVWLPTGVVGEYLTGSIAFHEPPPAVTAERVDDNVAAFLSGLRAERAKVLTAAQNGHGGPPAGPSGLILP